MIQKTKMTENMQAWRRRFFTIWAGQAFSLLGSALVQFALIWWVAVQSGSPLALSIALLVGILPQAVLGPFIGVLVDRRDRKLILILSDWMVALAGLVLAVTFFFGITELWHIYVILGVRAFCTAFQMPAMESSISLIVPQDKLVNVAGYNQILFGASNIVGPALGAVALATLPMYGVLAIDVIGVIIASITLFLVQIPRPPKVEAESEEKHVFREMHFGLKTLMQNKGLYHLTLIMAFMCFIFMPVASLFPLMTLEHFGGGATQASIVEVAFGVGMILGSALLSVLGWVKKKINLIMTGVISMGVFTMAMGALPSEGYRFFVLFSALMGAGMPLFNGPYMALIQSTIEPGVQGRVMSFSFSAMTIASPLGLIASGVFADQIGVPMWFFISGIIMTAGSVVAYFLPSLHKIE